MEAGRDVHPANLSFSHIHRVISAAMGGESGQQRRHTWLSPLLPLYWFFSLAEAAETHVFLPHLAETESIWGVTPLIEGLRKGIKVRDRYKIPI